MAEYKWEPCDPEDCEYCYGSGEYWECQITGECSIDGCGPIECTGHARYVLQK